MRQSELTAEIEAQAEQSYSQLTGKWQEYLEVAKRFEHKVEAQDRYDMRHTIILRLAQIANHQSGKTLTKPTMYRVASITIADYWRTHYKITNGLDCGSCNKAQRQKCRKDWLYSECPKAIKLEYLSKPMVDSEGNLTELGELIADDKAIDLDAWLDYQTFLLGCPERLIRIVNKMDEGKPLSAKDRMYLSRYRHKEQNPLF